MTDDKEKIAIMRIALEEAEKARDCDEVPVGAVILIRESGEVIAKARNRTRELNDPTAHAETLALRQACEKAGAQRIPEMDLYVTLEPCPMCAAALSYARIGHIYIGAEDPKSGGIIHGPQIYKSSALHHKPGFDSGYLETDCANILKDFFRSKRNSKNQVSI